MKQNVLGFQISMYDVVIMHVLNCMADLLDYISDFLFAKPALGSKMLVEASGRAEFHYEIEMVLVCENRVELDDVGVI